MKYFLSITFLIECGTGIALLVIPYRIILLLLGIEMVRNGVVIIPMLAGAAILSLVFSCWKLTRNAKSHDAMHVLLFYNLIVAVIFLFGALEFALNTPGMWVVICFHSIQSILGVVLLKVNKQNGQG